MKKLYFVLLSTLFLFQFVAVFAVERSDGDCKNIAYYENLIWKISFDKNIILNKEVYVKSLENLKKYCDNQDNVLQTPIFYNHLLDVSFRKIDAIKWAMYWIKPDELWLQWREFLNNVEEKALTDPKKISETFKKIWWSPQDNINSNPNTLYGRYKLACDELLNISDKVITSKSTDDKTSQMINSYLSVQCYNLAKKKYEQAVKVATKVSIQNFYNRTNNKLFKKLNEEFTEKVSRLFDKMMVLLWDFEYVVRRYIHATDVK